MVIIFRDLSIAILIWMVIFFLHGFFKELYKNLKERYEDWENKKRILRETAKLVKEGSFDQENGREGSMGLTVKGNKIIIERRRR